MEDELCIKLDVPPEYKEEFKKALVNAIESFKEELEFSIAESIASKSKLTEEQALELGDKIKEGMWKRYKEKGW